MNQVFSALTLLMIALGGACGALSRYTCGIIVTKILGSGFPYGTLFVNCFGSFIMGIAVTAFAHKNSLISPAAIFLMVGFLGAFTTYSSFALDTMNLIYSSQIYLAVINILSNALLSVGFVILGMMLTNCFL